MKTLSKAFDVQRGVVQGDIISPSPFLLILTLDRLVKRHDIHGTGIGCDNALQIRVLVYADDVVLLEPDVGSVPRCDDTKVDKPKDSVREEDDMEVSMTKTKTQHVGT